MNPQVCILDYGSGNVGSVRHLLNFLGVTLRVSNSTSDIDTSSHIVLPGVGAFPYAMKKIQQLVNVDHLTESVFDRRKPILGICVGMQVLASYGLEGSRVDGLNWIPGVVRPLKSGTMPLPQMGWNNVNVKHPEFNFLDDVDFYFVHSYAYSDVSKDHVVATTEYGESYPSIVRRDNILGVQFHPEKSQKAGIQLFKHFLGLSK